MLRPLTEEDNALRWAEVKFLLEKNQIGEVILLKFNTN